MKCTLSSHTRATGAGQSRRWRPARSRRFATQLGAAAVGALVLLAPRPTLAGEAVSRYIEVKADGGPLRLHYKELGKGPPVLLLHGYGSNTYTWRRLMLGLARGRRVIALDLKGFGESDKPLDTLYSAADQARVVARFIKALDLRGITLVGHSFGGGIALYLALEDEALLGGRITDLVLLDTVAYAQRVPIFFRMLQVPGLADLSMNLTPTVVQVRVALRIAYYDDSLISKTAVDAYAGPLRLPGAKHALVETVRQLVPADLDALERRYASLATPTLILWCDHDKIVPIQIGRRLASDLPNARFRVIESCGHLPQEEQPEQTALAIASFLARPRPSASIDPPPHEENALDQEIQSRQ